MLGRALMNRPVARATNQMRLLSNGRVLREMSASERQKIIRDANKTMKGYVETRILAKQGKLRKRKASEETQSASKIQLSLLISLGAAFIASPILGKKIATDQEFRDKYIPEWYDFRIRAPSSAWTRQELHEQLVEVERDMRERAIRGEFSPERIVGSLKFACYLQYLAHNLLKQDMKRQLHPRSDLTEEDLYYAKKYGWGRLHPGVDDDEDDDED